MRGGASTQTRNPRSSTPGASPALPAGPHVAVAVSITAPIGDDVSAAAGDGFAVYEIAPRGVPQGRELLSARTSLVRFADAYHGLLGRIEADQAECEVIDRDPCLHRLSRCSIDPHRGI